jgi:hypothetical protein
VLGMTFINTLFFIVFPAASFFQIPTFATALPTSLSFDALNNKHGIIFFIAAFQ